MSRQATAFALGLAILAVGAAPAFAGEVPVTNMGFEDPASALTEYRLIDDTLVPGWSTTAGDNRIEVWSNGFNGVTSAEGNQHAELNATQSSTLFNTVTTGTINVPHSITFYHRGRAGVDTARIAIEQGGVITVLGDVSTGSGAWGQYQFAFIPTMATFTVQFTSVSTASGNATVGNFLDGVAIMNPEPGTMALLGMGLLGLGGMVVRRRRRRNVASATSTDDQAAA